MKLLQNFRLRFRLWRVARQQRRLEKRWTQKLLRLWRAETRRDRLRLWLLLSPLQLLSRFLEDSAADENAKTVCAPDRPKPWPRTGEKIMSAKSAHALLRWLLQLLRRCLLRSLVPLCRWLVRFQKKLSRRIMVWFLSKLLNLLAWRLRGKPVISSR